MLAGNKLFRILQKKKSCSSFYKEVFLKFNAIFRKIVQSCLDHPKNEAINTFRKTRDIEIVGIL